MTQTPATTDPYIPPPAGQVWLVPTDAPVDDDLVRVALDNAFPGLPEGLTLEHAERSIRAALAAALPLYERRLRQRIAEEIQRPGSEPTADGLVREGPSEPEQRFLAAQEEAHALYERQMRERRTEARKRSSGKEPAP